MICCWAIYSEELYHQKPWHQNTLEPYGRMAVAGQKINLDWNWMERGITYDCNVSGNWAWTNFLAYDFILTRLRQQTVNFVGLVPAFWRIKSNNLFKLIITIETCLVYSI